MPTSLFAAITNLPDHEDLVRAPSIPPRRIASIRDLHAEHLPDAETVLLVCGNGKPAAVLTPTRICWKNMFEPPRHVLLADLQVGMIGKTETAVRLSGTEIDMLGTPEMIGPIADLLGEIASGSIPIQRPHPVSDSDRSRAIRKAFMDEVGVVEEIFYGPSLPKRKEEGARRSHSGLLPADESILVLYDDTVFGSAEEGFVVTAKRLYWKGILQEPQREAWKELAPGSITPAKSGLMVGELELQITARDQLVPGIIRAIVACAQFGKVIDQNIPDASGMLRCGWCGRRNRAGDPICDGCGAPT